MARQVSSCMAFGAFPASRSCNNEGSAMLWSGQAGSAIARRLITLPAHTGKSTKIITYLGTLLLLDGRNGGFGPSWVR